MKVTRIDVQVLGERNYPLVTGRLTEEQSKDFYTVLASARLLNAATTPEDVIRAIWRLGTRRVQTIIAQGTPVKVEDLPGVKPPREPQVEITPSLTPEV